MVSIPTLLQANIWQTAISPGKQPLQRNVGLDFTTLGGRLSGTIEGYWNNTKTC